MRLLADTAIVSIEQLLNATDHPSDRENLARFLQLYSQKSGFHRPKGGFEYFGKLPPELRIQVWNGALPGPELAQDTVTPLLSGTIRPIMSVERPVHPIFDVCWEPRLIALEKYAIQLMEYPSSL